MLDFFRRHQRYFFVIITIVIVISFSFFGTYSSLSDGSFREQIAFRTVNGTDVTRHELDEMVAFISTDSLDKLLFGGAWGPNFLNNGVIRQDFLETGLAAMLIEAYPSDLQSDLEARLEKEKRFSLYSNPQAPYVGVLSAWTNFSPAMKTYYTTLKEAKSPLDHEAINSRIGLFLAERQFPSQLLRQVIRYQEKQYAGLLPDPNLDYTDLSLFNYHTLEDWFGPRFVRLVSQFIINAASIAEQKGYEVSKADAMADLVRNSEASYRQNSKNPNLAVASSQEYFNEQLRRLGMDANKASKLWRQVLLFQRYFQDMGSSVFIDPNTFAGINSYALEGVEGELFRLPREFRFNDASSLQKFEVYLDAVSQRSEKEKSSLLLPNTFLSLSEVSKQTPELVQKRYTLEIASVDKKALQAKVGVKESWNWEVEGDNWEKLKKQFPELGLKKGDTRQERFAILDSLDPKTRGRVDTFARAAIVESEPKRLDAALLEANPETMKVALYEKGGSSAFIGLKDGKPLMRLLDSAPLASQKADKQSSEQNDANNKLSKYSPDGNTYYRIAVIERAKSPEIMSFKEAVREGVLEKLMDKKLEAYYVNIRENSPSVFQKGDQSWKSFSEVRGQIADRYFEPILKAIASSHQTAIAPENAPSEMISDFAATWRFYPYMKKVLAQIKNDPKAASALTQGSLGDSRDETKIIKSSIADQWKLEKLPYQTTRSRADDLLNHEKLFAQESGSWTDVNTPANGDINFFYLEKKSSVPDRAVISESVAKARALLSADAQQKLMMSTLEEIKEKQAISLQYLNQTEEVAEGQGP